MSRLNYGNVGNDARRWALTQTFTAGDVDHVTNVATDAYFDGKLSGLDEGHEIGFEDGDNDGYERAIGDAHCATEDAHEEETERTIGMSMFDHREMVRFVTAVMNGDTIDAATAGLDYRTLQAWTRASNAMMVMS